MIKLIKYHNNRLINNKMAGSLMEILMAHSQKRKTFPNLETFSFPVLCPSDISAARTPFPF